MYERTPMSQTELLALHERLSAKAREIMSDKNDDYADPGSFDVFGNLDACHSFGICSTEEGILIRLLDKMKRLVNSTNRELKVKDETIEDTCLDIMNYIVLYLAKIEARRRAVEPDRLAALEAGNV